MAMLPSLLAPRLLQRGGTVFLQVDSAPPLHLGVPGSQRIREKTQLLSKAEREFCVHSASL